MFGKTIDRIEARLAPHLRKISILAMAWFWVGVALQARFIRLPELPWLSERVVFWAAVAFNAGWWGWLQPAIASRRRARALAEQAVLPN